MIQPDTDAVVWLRCGGSDQLAVVPALSERLRSEGESVRLVATLPQDLAAAHGVAAHPLKAREITAFLTRLRPMMIIWAGGEVDNAILRGSAAAGIPLVLVDVDASALSLLRKRIFQAGVRKSLGQLAAVFARDDASAAAFTAMGTNPATTFAVGLLEDPPAVLPHNEDDRRDLAEALGNRPLWLATQVRPSDVDGLAKAQRQAARRSHRLMLAVLPQDPDQSAEIADQFAQLGFPVIFRSDTPLPEESTQVMIGDSAGEVGLWLRIAPVTFVVGTLNNTAAQDPFQIAALGSVLVHGPMTQPFAARFDRLMAAKATSQVSNVNQLGAAIEVLLAPDTVAQMATAGWDVTSRGAETTDRMIDLIRNRLDTLGF